MKLRLVVLSYREELQAAAGARADQVVRQLVAEFGGRTVRRAGTRLLSRPGVNVVEPEPLACLETARELERAAHDMQLEYIRLARQTGRSWFEIGHALDLFWESTAGDDSIADVAYDHANRYDNPHWEKRDFTWTCPACQQTIIDHGPWPAVPEHPRLTSAGD